MSETTPADESGTSSDEGLISDEQLPDDLRPDKNPMARDPDDPDTPVSADGSAGDSDGPAGAPDGPAGGSAPR